MVSLKEMKNTVDNAIRDKERNILSNIPLNPIKKPITKSRKQILIDKLIEEFSQRCVDRCTDKIKPTDALTDKLAKLTIEVLNTRLKSTLHSRTLEEIKNDAKTRIDEYDISYMEKYINSIYIDLCKEFVKRYKYEPSVTDNTKPGSLEVFKKFIKLCAEKPNKANEPSDLDVLNELFPVDKPNDESKPSSLEILNIYL